MVMQNPQALQPRFLFSIPLGQAVLTAVGHLAVDRNGNIYATQTRPHQLVKLGPTGSEIWRISTIGNGEAQFNAPAGVAVDSSGNVYVTDTNNNCVQKFDP